MHYRGQYPPFTIEKPKAAVWRSEHLRKLALSGKCIAELKLNEKRTFFASDAKGRVVLYTYRHERPLQFKPEQVAGLVLPPNSLFDGGVFQNLKLGKDPRFWIFDVLATNGKLVREPLEFRLQMREELLARCNQGVVFTPPRTQNPIQEFQAIMDRRSTLVAELAQKMGLTVEQLYPFIEGVVIKDLAHRHGFPLTGIKTPAGVYKLRVADVVPGKRNWLIPL